MTRALIGLALLLFALAPAAAQERGSRGWQGRSGYGAAPYARGYAPGGWGRGPYGGRYQGPYGAPPPRGYPGYPGYPGGGRRPGGPGPPAPPRAFGRGQILPQAYWGGLLADPRIYRLRRPPNGYGWVVVGPNAYLMQLSTGLILDTAPLY